jgi:hypothetical protein
MMKKRKGKFGELSSSGLLLLTTVMLLPVMGAAAAKEHKAKGSDNQAQVVAHIAFSGLSEVDMTMQKRTSDKYYIYVQHSKDEGISIIDISKPTQPKAVAVIPWPDPAVSGGMNVAGSLAIVAKSGVVPSHGRTSNDDLVLWDLSNPASPRLVQEFSGVIKWLQDERHFVYVLNADGLWVVSKPQSQRTPSRNKWSSRAMEGEGKEIH